jgi:hypothetical protein
VLLPRECLNAQCSSERPGALHRSECERLHAAACTHNRGVPPGCAAASSRQGLEVRACVLCCAACCSGAASTLTPCGCAASDCDCGCHPASLLPLQADGH